MVLFDFWVLSCLYWLNLSVLKLFTFGVCFPWTFQFWNYCFPWHILSVLKLSYSCELCPLTKFVSFKLFATTVCFTWQILSVLKLFYFWELCPLNKFFSFKLFASEVCYSWQIWLVLKLFYSWVLFPLSVFIIPVSISIFLI